ELQQFVSLSSTPLRKEPCMSLGWIVIGVTRGSNSPLRSGAACNDQEYKN
ncbi:hypothetical protein A2U01_0061877, partial [Trifolium medium]|nr:hypothetical protein [Trifolium medium]